MRQGGASLVLAAVVVLMGLLLIARTIALGVGGGLRIYLAVVTWRNR